MRIAGRIAISTGLIWTLLVVCSRQPHVDHATVALLMVLAIVGLATRWGRPEALAATIAGGLGFDYYFLPPGGFGITSLEHWIAMVAFLATALAAGQLAARLKQQRLNAIERQVELEKLYRFSSILLGTANARSGMEVAEKVVEIFDVDGVALYRTQTGQISRFGPCAASITEQGLRETAASGRETDDKGSTFFVAPIRQGAVLVGSVGISGAKLSKSLLGAIAVQVGLGLARLDAIERTTEAEVVRRSQELKSALLDAMAHEIRNPLNSVKIAANALLSGHAGSPLQEQEMLMIIDEEVNRIDRFIDEAVHLAGVEASQLRLNKEPQNVGLMIPAAIEEMGAAVSRRRIEVRVPRSLPPAECDREMVLQVLKQLLNNALKYSPEDSPITVSAESTGAAITIDVEDRGPGVAPDECDRIFEKHYRGSAALSNVPGAGLGLASAKCVMQAHGGKIWVTEAPGGGAAFHVSLPVASARSTVGAT